MNDWTTCKYSKQFYVQFKDHMISVELYFQKVTYHSSKMLQHFFFFLSSNCLNSEIRKKMSWLDVFVVFFSNRNQLFFFCNILFRYSIGNEITRQV